MGMITAAPEARQDLELRSEGAESTEPSPFSHDSHFSLSARNAQGYRFQVIDEIIVIGGNGRIVAAERPALPLGERRNKGAMLVPMAPTPGRRESLGFLWGRSDSVLGFSGARPRTFEDLRAATDHLKFKALHHQLLEGVGDIALQAFLRFLELRAAGAVPEFPMIGERPRRRLAFRFQYDEHYLHERHAAQLAWKRFVTAPPPAAERTPRIAAGADASAHWSPKA